MLDDGADLVGRLHSARSGLLAGVIGGMEETTTGVPPAAEQRACLASWREGT